MNILLVNPASTNDTSQLNIPLNLLILSSVAKKQGAKVKILDLDFHVKIYSSQDCMETLKETIENTKFDVIGFTSNCLAYPMIFKSIEIIKEIDNSLLVFLGGPQAGICANETLKAYKLIDFIIIGEGEECFKELIKKKFENLSSISGLCIRDNERIIFTPERQLMNNLDMSPIPDFDAISLDKYLKEISKNSIPVVPIEVGRGCPFNCNFCCTSLFWQRKYRIKSVERVIKEVKVFRLHDAHTFTFIHDNLAANRNYVERLSEGLSRFKDIKWNMSSRVDNLDENLLRVISNGGCRGVFLGIETGSKRLQKKINKNIDLNKIQEVIENCKINGINTTCSFIIGFPDETKEELNQTLELALSCKVWGADIEIQTLSPLYGTELYFEYFDRIYLEENLYDKSNLILDNEYALNAIKNHKELFSFFYSIRNDYVENSFLWFTLFFFRIAINNSPFKLKDLIKSNNKTLLEVCEKIYQNSRFKCSRLSEKELQFDLAYRLHKILEGDF